MRVAKRIKIGDKSRSVRIRFTFMSKGEARGCVSRSVGKGAIVVDV